VSSVIQPLKIGALYFPVNLIQGPLAGVSSAPFRALVWKHGSPAFCYTEMISCKTILYSPEHRLARYVAKSVDEGPLCFQLSSQDSAELSKAALRVAEYGADLIDLNCGCPMKKIRSKGTGSRLLSDPSKLYKLIIALKNSVSMPVLVKIRVDARSDDRFNADIAKAVTEAGADALVVHGRHWTEEYDVPCYYPDIQFFAESLAIPVIGNGDIADVSSLIKMFETGCAGVMLGRYSVGQPWLTKQLQAEMLQQSFVKPSHPVVGELLIEHVRGLIHLLQHEQAALREARKFAKYYARSLQNRDEFTRDINGCDDFNTFMGITKHFFVDPHE